MYYFNSKKQTNKEKIEIVESVNKEKMRAGRESNSGPMIKLPMLYKKSIFH